MEKALYDSLRLEANRLRPGRWLGWAIVAWVLAVTASGLALALSPSWGAWLAGEAILAVAMVQWFALLHECGHGTLFAGRTSNALVGHLAGAWSALPFLSWRSIHYRHHLWSGWQDLDPTTEQVVPRPISAFERVLADTCWRTGFPLFSILYRVNNFWNAPRLWRMFGPGKLGRAILWNLVLLALTYLALAAAMGPRRFAVVLLPAFFLHLVLCDPLLLSQHTHIPQRRSGGAAVIPNPPRDQDVFARSLVFPTWVSRLVLFEFEAHEAHHVFPRVPGYRLHRLGFPAARAIGWRDWLRRAKAVPAHVLLFQDQRATGLDF